MDEPPLRRVGHLYVALWIDERLDVSCLLVEPVADRRARDVDDGIGKQASVLLYQLRQIVHIVEDRNLLRCVVLC